MTIRRKRLTPLKDLFPFKIILIQPLELDRLDVTDTHAKLNHVIRQLHAIDKYDCCRQRFCVLSRFPREIGGCKKNALARSLPVESAGKLLNVRSSDRSLPPLRLHVDVFQT